MPQEPTPLEHYCVGAGVCKIQVQPVFIQTCITLTFIKAQIQQKRLKEYWKKIPRAHWEDISQTNVGMF